jgi:putative membrane protein
MDLPRVPVPDAVLRGRRARRAERAVRTGGGAGGGESVKTAGEIVVAIVALEHLYIMLLEMVLWTTPRGRAAFGTTAEEAEQTAVLAKNQGLYNGFLAAGLVWALITTDHEAAFEFKIVFVACVIAAAIFGGLTVSRRILLVQGAPAVVALVLVLIGGR